MRKAQTEAGTSTYFAYACYATAATFQQSNGSFGIIFKKNKFSWQNIYVVWVKSRTSNPSDWILNFIWTFYRFDFNSKKIMRK